jgi:hypothetical protein
MYELASTAVGSQVRSTIVHLGSQPRLEITECVKNFASRVYHRVQLQQFCSPATSSMVLAAILILRGHGETAFVPLLTSNDQLARHKSARKSLANHLTMRFDTWSFRCTIHVVVVSDSRRASQLCFPLMYPTIILHIWVTCRSPYGAFDTSKLIT